MLPSGHPVGTRKFGKIRGGKIELHVASLRNAAGQLIENVTKSMRRKETVDDAYYEKLYADITSLYRLNQLGGAAEGRQELGEMPTMSKVLIGVLAGTWVLIGAYVLADMLKKKKNQN